MERRGIGVGVGVRVWVSVASCWLQGRIGDVVLCLVLATHMFQSKRTQQRIQKLYMAWLHLHVASVHVVVAYLVVLVVVVVAECRKKNFNFRNVFRFFFLPKMFSERLEGETRTRKNGASYTHAGQQTTLMQIQIQIHLQIQIQGQSCLELSLGYEHCVFWTLSGACAGKTPPDNDEWVAYVCVCVCVLCVVLVLSLGLKSV